MSDVAIRVEGLGKRYRLGAKQEPYYSLRDSIVGVARKPLQLARRISHKSAGAGVGRPEFWALKDVDFEVNQGEVLGIIGRNGAGKSTLLKILSEVTEPTAGHITMGGRVASLLEVGTGFHPELTGRENIYLNAAILGMSKAEVARKFEEIVDFAEVGRFIDTQVKRYSSGMYLRLAFAVAAHLEPEILIVDEVLAVGDARFQQKCLGKMGEISKSDRTVLFVSHSMPSILSLCTRCILLDQGHLVTDGPPSMIIDQYLNSGVSHSLGANVSRVPRRGQGHIRFTSLRAQLSDGTWLSEIPMGSDCTFHVGYESDVVGPIDGCTFDLTVTDASGQMLFKCASEHYLAGPARLLPCGELRFRISKFPLTTGTYGLVLYLEQDHIIQDWIWPPIQFYVVDGRFHPGPKQFDADMAGRGFLVDFDLDLSGGESSSRIDQESLYLLLS